MDSQSLFLRPNDWLLPRRDVNAIEVSVVQACHLLVLVVVVSYPIVGHAKESASPASFDWVMDLLSDGSGVLYSWIARSKRSGQVGGWL